MCSTLIFRHGKLSMRTFFTHVAITDQNLFYFFTLITLMIAHSAMASIRASSAHTAWVIFLTQAVWAEDVHVEAMIGFG